MGENVQFAVGAAIQALKTDPRIEALVREVGEACPVFIGSGVGDLPESYRAAAAMDRATRLWNHFWAQPSRCGARRHFEAGGATAGAAPPADPASLPHRQPGAMGCASTHGTRIGRAGPRRSGASGALCGGRAPRCRRRRPRQGAPQRHSQTAARASRPGRGGRAARRRLGPPSAPTSSGTSKMRPPRRSRCCSTFTVRPGRRSARARRSVWRSSAGATRSDGARPSSRSSARPIRGPIRRSSARFTTRASCQGSARSTCRSRRCAAPTSRAARACGFVGDPAFCAEEGMTPLAYVESVAISSDAEHIITPSKSGPKRAIAQAYREAGIAPDDVAIIDLHATGTPGDLNELALVEEFIGERTRITARKGQLGHGMANSGGWELTAVALSLARGMALPTGIRAEAIHERVRHPPPSSGEAARRRRGRREVDAGHRRHDRLRRPAWSVKRSGSP